MYDPALTRSPRNLGRIAVAAFAASLLAPNAHGAPKPKMPNKSKTPRREAGPGFSHGPLSDRFPEIEVKASSSFAHDHGTTSHVDSLTVAGTASTPAEVLQKLVAHRKGWTASGGSSDADVLKTMQAFVDDWAEVFPYTGRMTGPTATGLLPVYLSEGGPEYHPPRLGLYALDDGDKIVTHAFFHSHDAGTHGRMYRYIVQAFRVSTGAAYSLGDPTGRPSAKTSGPQPLDASVPRPQRIRD